MLAWVDERFGATAAQMSSFGLEDVALFDMFWRVNPQARLIGSEEVAAAALWLCSHGARSVNGHALPVSGGEV